MPQTLCCRVVAVSHGGNEDLSKQPADEIEVNFSGIVGDRHAGASRETWAGEREPKGTRVRNDRQWSGVSVEELAFMNQQLDLAEAIVASTLGANVCVEGIEDFSLLPRGTRLKFPSGAALVVEEYNPPCIDMSMQIAGKHLTRSGQSLGKQQWMKVAAGRRGVVGMVDVPGVIRVGDEVQVDVFQPPEIRRFS